MEFFFYISERYEIKLYFGIKIFQIGPLLKSVEWNIQLVYFVTYRFLYAAALQLLLNDFDKLAELILETHIAYFRVLEEPFEILL